MDVIKYFNAVKCKTTEYKKRFLDILVFVNQLALFWLWYKMFDVYIKDAEYN